MSNPESREERRFILEDLQLEATSYKKRLHIKWGNVKSQLIAVRVKAGVDVSEKVQFKKDCYAAARVKEKEMLSLRKGRFL